MARKYSNEERMSLVDEKHAKLLYRSLEQYNKEQTRRKRPSVLLAALICLFLSSGGGIALAVVLMVQPTEIQSACIARDLILFAAIVALVYICLHVKGARKDYWRKGNGPPQIYGDYLHASALLIARAGIAIWGAALIATTVMIAKAVHRTGLASTAPYLDLVICIGAIPSFVVISATIEINATPFATTGVSSPSFLSRRCSQFSDESTEDLSVSRRASLQRKESTNGSILTLPTAEIFKLGSSKPEAPTNNTEPLMIQTQNLPYDGTELMANSPIGAPHNAPTAPHPVRTSHVPSMRKLQLSLSKSPPLPVYNPGGWRNEWNNVAEQVGVSMIPETATNSSNTNQAVYYTSTYTAASGGSSRGSTQSKTSNKTGRGHRVTPSTSITSSAHRSRLSTVRYAAEPEVAVRQEIRVIRNPHYSPATIIDVDRAIMTVRRPEPAVLQNAVYQGQDAGVSSTLKRNPSNFSRPLLPSRGSDEVGC
ncbi:hypothetical protein M426DRAFT_17532 [Hypoxylon sp. CI-4A]|nr:hypothetical protein M426DRAFT_17532 [Hypoxylon sp. CI-4A]